MKTLYKRTLSFGLTLLMVLSCVTSVASATNVVSGANNVGLCDSFTSPDGSSITPHAASRVYFGTVTGSFNSSSQPKTSGKIPAWPLGQKYAPYVSISPGGQTFAFYVEIYKSGSFVYSATYNISNGNLSGPVRIGGDNLKLGSGNYEFRVGFNTSVTNVSLNFYADPV